MSKNTPTREDPQKDRILSRKIKDDSTKLKAKNNFFLKSQCGGGDSNPRTPTRQDPESCTFDQTRQPPLTHCL